MISQTHYRKLKEWLRRKRQIKRSVDEPIERKISLVRCNAGIKLSIDINESRFVERRTHE
jgi:hypothetical protein